MGIRIKKRDRDLEWLSAYRDLENPGRVKAKKSSNMVFIGTVSAVGIAAIIYAQLISQNMTLLSEIRTHEDYINSQRNIDMYEWHTLLQERSVSLINYRDGAEKFLEQLKTTNRLSEADFRYFEEALKDSTSPRAYITGFAVDYNAVQIRGSVPEEHMPRMFAEYLTNQKDGEGNPRFASVDYSGFSQNQTFGYEFTVTVVLWNQVK